MHPDPASAADPGADQVASSVGDAVGDAVGEGPSDALQVRTFRLELLAGTLWAGSLAILEMGPALAKKAFDASDFEVALLTSGQSLGLVLSFFTSHLSTRVSRVRLAFWLHLASNLALVPTFFLRPSFALAFVLLLAAARVGHSMAVPARILVYRSNFPAASRGRLVGRLNRAKLLLTTGFAFVVSALFDWNFGTPELVRLLGECPVPADRMVNWAVPVLAVLGVLGCFVYARIAEAKCPVDPLVPPLPASTSLDTLREFVQVWRQDRAFRRYETFFFVFGFANIMSIPLTQIHAVDRLGASYFDLAMINVVLVQGLMALSMVAWGDRLDRSNPSRLRGVLNLVLAVDFVMLAVAPAIGWVYVGRIFRGIAMGGGTLLWMLGPLWFAGNSRKEPIYTGIHAVLTGVRWGLAPFVGVWLKATFADDSRPIFWIGAAILVLTAVAMLREGRRGGSTPPAVPPPIVPPSPPRA